MAAPAVLALALCAAGCSSLPFGRDRAPPPAPPADSTEGASPTAQPPTAPGDAERIDASTAPPNQRRGFFRGLAKRLGSDSATANVGPCPAVRVLYDASRFVELDGPERYENVGFTGEIENVQSSCRYVGDEPVAVSIELTMGFGRGPKAQGSSKDVVYWVSAARKDVAVIGRERFTQRIAFAPGETRQRVTTPVTQVTIPRANKDISGANFEVFVGFELTDAQLAFNRDGKRFRVDSGPVN